jgi:hypothetical protein
VSGNADALELGRGVPGWVARVVITVVAGGIVAVLAAGGIAGAVLGLVCLAVVLSIAMPASPAPTLVLVLVALSVAVIGSDPFTGPVLVLVPLVHLFHVSCSISGVLPLRARVHLAALRIPAVRFGSIQAGVFALAGLLALVPAGRPSAPLEVAAIGGVAVIALLLLRLLYRQR